MDASPVKIFEYFNGEKQSLIPLFQRPYSWEQKHWKALWEDILQQYDPNDRSQHFMGAVVSVPAVSKPVGVTKHFVIDGQQRLTTLSILLAAIREKCVSDGYEKTVAKIDGYLTNPHEEEPDDLKLVPTQVDREAFKALVRSKESDEFAESRVFQAYNYFKRALEGSDEEGEPLDARIVLDVICQALLVVMINLSESDDPYLIFESLNHKGEPLTQSDLVRNYILMRFPHTTSSGGVQQQIYDSMWKPMEDALGTEVSEFMRHYLMRLGKNVRKSEIYTAMKAHFQPLEDSEAVKAGLGEMKRAAFAYEKFLQPDKLDNPRASAKLHALAALDTKVFYPLLLRLYDSYAVEALSTDEFVHCLTLIESFYVRRAVCGVPTNALNKVSLELCGQYPDDGIVAWLRDRLKTGNGGRRWPTDEEFEESLTRDRVYQRKKVVRFLLVELEIAQKHKEPVDPNSATIEHILPQTLTQEWKVELGNDWELTFERWLDTLGNLTLTGYNASLGNLPFAEKKAKLENTHFEITRWLLSRDAWNEESILERAKWLSKTALERWPRP
ncbi:DUF262 domain-containing protein [Roseibacillus ishigakijimensis]|uniref:DUF262 domain-containing protein n=1 Tax=Roseibacillus ishigakijimensis TaxID=454146 RepID=A0A934RV26_9BACT|nr:DUF262 domain-containing protein [Roseibacillus ishigakijimensis]MBK1835539.1 DUF262 domain-containing protein [Roseibacillus ishigakijimensis]